VHFCPRSRKQEFVGDSWLFSTSIYRFDTTISYLRSLRILKQNEVFHSFNFFSPDFSGHTNLAASDRERLRSGYVAATKSANGYERLRTVALW
jgi:hypothetical protein